MVGWVGMFKKEKEKEKMKELERIEKMIDKLVMKKLKVNNEKLEKKIDFELLSLISRKCEIKKELKFVG